jgi:hypothetical protein
MSVVAGKERASHRCGMARSLKIEYRGALTHVLNRGNYRANVFLTDGAKEAFLGLFFNATPGMRLVRKDSQNQVSSGGGIA